MKALLQFNRFKVLELIYKIDLSSDFSDELSPTFAVQIQSNESDIKQAIVNLSVEIGEPADKAYLKATIAGFFTFDTSDGEVTEDVIYKYYEINGTAILFPYLRSIVSDLTSKGDDSPIILPTLNIPAMLKAQEEEED